MASGVGGRDLAAVTEEGGDCVTVLDGLRGWKHLSFGSYGSDEGEFDSPRGVAVDGEGNILVADYGNHRIQKFTAKGKFVSAVGSKGSGELQFDHPSGIAFNKIKRLAYVVDENHRVQVVFSYNSAFYFHDVFGVRGDGVGQFESPQGIACDSNTGKIYVADTGNHCIQVFSAEMKFLCKIHIYGSDGMDYPIGIAVDSKGNVYVTECGRVFVFTPEEGGVRSLARRGSDFGSSPGLAVGRVALYVCGDERVQVVTKGFLVSRLLWAIIIFFAGILLTILFKSPYIFLGFVSIAIRFAIDGMF